MKVFNPNFSINIVVKPKIRKSTFNDVISRKCIAQVIIEDEEFKASIKISDNNNLILPFTENTFSLKGKTHVFAKNKDENNHNVCIIRNNETANLYPGTDLQYDVLKENLLIAGYIISKDNKKYFDYTDLVAFHILAESNVNNIKIDYDKPLFNK